MKLFKKSKDGGPDSTAYGYWLIESKKLFSIVLLNFQGKSREVFHDHAFSAISWVIKGGLREETIDGKVTYYLPSIRPIITPKKMFHRVDSIEPNTWAISFRGPWVHIWKEYWPKEGLFVKLTPGREISGSFPYPDPTSDDEIIKLGRHLNPDMKDLTDEDALYMGKLWLGKL